MAIPRTEIETSATCELVLSDFDERHGISCIHSRHAINASFNEIAERIADKQ